MDECLGVGRLLDGQLWWEQGLMGRIVIAAAVGGEKKETLNELCFKPTLRQIFLKTDSSGNPVDLLSKFKEAQRQISFKSDSHGDAGNHKFDRREAFYHTHRWCLRWAKVRPPITQRPSETLSVSVNRFHPY
jgi:hypothetical protein